MRKFSHHLSPQIELIEEPSESYGEVVATSAKLNTTELINVSFTMHKLTVLPANLTHLNEINVLMRASKGYWGYNDTFLNKFMHIFKVTDSCIRQSVMLRVFLDEDLIGFYSFLERENDLELDMFFLHPKYIGKGLGKKLWDKCLKTMHELGYVSFYLVADPNANSFYEKMGCIKTGEKKSVMGRGRINNIYRFSTDL